MGGPDAVCQRLDTQHPDIHELVGERMFTEIPEDHFAWEAAKCVEERPLHLHTPRPHLRLILPGMMRGSGVNAGHAHCFGHEKHISSCRAHLSYLHQFIGHSLLGCCHFGTRSHAAHDSLSTLHFDRMHETDADAAAGSLACI